MDVRPSGTRPSLANVAMLDDGAMSSRRFLRNTWYVAMWAGDLEIGQVERREIIGEPMAIYRGSDGTVAAITDQCAHRFAPLSQGRVCGDRLECPYHGLQFGRTGACEHNPHGSGRITPQLHLRSYPVVERHTLLWIWMGDAEPTPDTIPDFSHLDDDAPGIVSKRDWMVLDVDDRLMADNLLDLSHANYLHDGLLGHRGLEDAEVEIREEIEPTGVTSLYVTRTSRDVVPPHLFDLMFRNDGAPVDTWAEMRWNAPGVLRNHAGVTEPGATREEGLILIGSHLLTPIDERRTAYHIAAVQLGAAAPVDDAEVSETLSRLRRFAFEEQDRPMVEAQQRAYDRAGGPDAIRPVMLSIDRGPLRARQILAGLIADEQQPVELVLSGGDAADGTRPAPAPR
jgi:phenylpropionate dioxygenase-like ring-hydroxylating dioxygenase large terminal subunit